MPDTQFNIPVTSVSITTRKIVPDMHALRCKSGPRGHVSMCVSVHAGM